MNPQLRSRIGLGHISACPDDVPMHINCRAICEDYLRNAYARAEFEIEHHGALGSTRALTRLHLCINGLVPRAFLADCPLPRGIDWRRVPLSTPQEEDLQEMKHHAAQ